MDVIALDRYGFGYAVAPLGTALTEEQIAEAWRVCPEPILCLDGDSPGVKAAMRAVDRVLPMLKAGYSLQFLFLPDNQDPDEYLQAHGHDSFAALMRKTSPLIDILWRKYTENEDSSTPEKKALIEKTLLSEVAKIGDATVRSYYAQEIRNRIYAAFRRTPWQQPAAPVPPAPRMPVPPTPKMPETPPAYLDDIPLPEVAPQHRKPQPDRPSQAPRQFANAGLPSNSGSFPDTAPFSGFRPSFNAVPLSGGAHSPTQLHHLMPAHSPIPDAVPRAGQTPEPCAPHSATALPPHRKPCARAPTANVTKTCVSSSPPVWSTPN